MYYINIILFSALVIPYTAIYIKRNKLTPVSTFLVMEMSMFYGICFYRGNTSLKGTSEVGIKLETIYVVALFFFILGGEFAKRVKMSKGVSRATSWGNGTDAVSYTHLDVYKRQMLYRQSVICV